MGASTQEMSEANMGRPSPELLGSCVLSNCSSFLDDVWPSHRANEEIK